MLLRFYFLLTHVTCPAHRERRISIKLKIAASTLLSRGAGCTTIVVMFNCYDARQRFELLPLIRGISGSNLYSQTECFDYVSREFLRSFWVNYWKTSLNNTYTHTYFFLSIIQIPFVSCVSDCEQIQRWSIYNYIIFSHKWCTFDRTNCHRRFMGKINARVHNLFPSK
jgi:hypothetical protein